MQTLSKAAGSETGRTSTGLQEAAAERREMETTNQRLDTPSEAVWYTNSHHT